MKPSLFKLLTLAILLQLATVSCLAQQPGPAAPDRDGGWLSIGIGRGVPYDFSGVVSANFGRVRFWQVAYNGTGDLSLGGKVAGGGSVSFGRGHSFVDRIGRVAGSIGPGFVWGQYWHGSPTTELSSFKTIGLVASAQFVLTPIKEVGFGIDLYSNVNSIKTVGGIRLSIVLEGNK